MVELVHLRVGAPIALRVEVGERAEQESGGVADAPVGVGEPVHDLEREPDVLGGILRGDPQTQHLGAVLRDELLRRDVVAAGLGYLPPLAVHHEAVGETAR